MSSSPLVNMSSSYPSYHHHHVSRAVEHPHPLSPAFPSRTQHQLHPDTERAQPTSTYGSSAQRRTSVTEEGPLETDPMLPSLLASHIHSPILVPSTDLVATMTQLDQGVEVNQADQTIEVPAPPPPPPPLKDPSPPPPLSKRLFNAIVHKPTLSRTWEKKSFVDEQKSAPAIIGGDESLERGNDLDGWAFGQFPFVLWQCEWEGECVPVANLLCSVWFLLPLQDPDQCRSTLLQQKLQRSNLCRLWWTRGMCKGIHKWHKSGCSL